MFNERICTFADNVELGTACGKLHRVSVLAITDAGADLFLSLALHLGLSLGAATRMTSCLRSCMAENVLYT